MSYGENGVLNQITKIRLPDGEEVAIVDWTWRPLYSTVDILSGATDPTFPTFNYADGDDVSASQNIVAAGNVRTANSLDTNVAAAAEMPAEQEFLCYAISVEVSQVRLTNDVYSLTTGEGDPIPNGVNLAILHQSLVLRLEVSQKDYFMAPMGYFPTGFGPMASAIIPAAAAAASRSYATNGLPSLEAIDKAPVPVHIGGTEKFGIFLDNPGIANSNTISFFDDEAGALDDTIMRCRVYMRGLQKRPAA